MQITKLTAVIDKGLEAEFRRTDGKKIYRIHAYWDKSVGSWFQEGAPSDVLRENTKEVENFFYKKFSFDFRGAVNEARSRI